MACAKTSANLLDIVKALGWTGTAGPVHFGVFAAAGLHGLRLVDKGLVGRAAHGQTNVVVVVTGGSAPLQLLIHFHRILI